MNENEHARLLLAILRERWEDARELARRGVVDPELFARLCLEADVPTWVHARLTSGEGRGLLGAETAERLGTIRARVRRDNLLLVARAEEAIGLLSRAGVVPVALKGLDLLYRVYTRIDERTLDDVDLLVRPEDLATALDALRAGGWELPPEPKRTHYIRSSHHLPLRSPGPVHVDFEVHWNLAQEMRFDVDAAGLVERAVPLEIAGQRVLRLDDHDLVAHLLLHHFTHYFDRRVKWAIDLREIARLPGFDWPTVAERIRSWGAVTSSGMSLLHLRKLFPDWIPREVLDRLPVAAWRRALAAPLRSDHPLDLFRSTRNRWVQLYLAAVLLERPWLMPRWLAHRALRDRRRGDNPLDDAGASIE